MKDGRKSRSGAARGNSPTVIICGVSHCPVHFVHHDDVPRLGVSERNCSDILTYNNQVRLHRAATPPTSMEGRKGTPRGRMIQTVHYLSVESPPLTLLMIRQTSSLSERPIGDR